MMWQNTLHYCHDVTEHVTLLSECGRTRYIPDFKSHTLISCNIFWYSAVFPYEMLEASFVEALTFV